jgi:predicted ribosome quality control (RQC) complex YloA/Tae2 family protein
MGKKVFNYKKYRWFFTKSNKLVYGGKSAEQNEELVKSLLKNKKEYLVTHTKIPGSPFGIIAAPPKEISEEDLEEACIWTACFSRAWRNGMKDAEIDVFKKSDVYKDKKMKSGTFGVNKKQKSKVVKLKLVLTIQKNVLRAIPEKSLKKNQKIITKFIPGGVVKDEFANKISKNFNKPKEEVLNALPTGGFRKVRK